jgi:hypothetical protein
MDPPFVIISLSFTVDCGTLALVDVILAISTAFLIN